MAKEEEATLKRGWIQGVKSEFRKIIWPDKNTLTKQTTAVIIVAFILGCLIAAIDWLLQIGLSFIVG
ncbi:MAG: preprotein translocase subunit SecE [Lachnospiraceae bacterium]|nr:preprotein translocase subunit SecE [Lachnospiraceae bacterium]